MKKHLLTFIAISAFAFCALFAVACSNGEHEHVFEEGWRNNADSHWHFCTVSGCNEQGDVAPHEFVFERITVEPNCFMQGEGVYKCSVCGYSKTDVVAPTGEHEYVSYWTSSKDRHFKRCVNSTYGCTAELSEPHTPGNPTLVNVATEYSDGVTRVRCTTCNYIMEETYTPAKEVVHNFDVTITKREQRGFENVPEPFAYYNYDDDNIHIATVICGDDGFTYEYKYSNGMTYDSEEVPAHSTNVFDYSNALSAGMRISIENIYTGEKVSLMQSAGNSNFAYTTRFVIQDGFIRIKEIGSFKLDFYYVYGQGKTTCSAKVVFDVRDLSDHLAWLEEWNAAHPDFDPQPAVISAIESV